MKQNHSTHQSRNLVTLPCLNPHFQKQFKKKGFYVKIQNFCKSCDLAHLCVVLGSESLHMGFNMMNPVDFSEKE